MNITVTGSLGNISKPLTQRLVKEGHSVTVISSDSRKQREIEALGATALTGKLEDANFLTSAFMNADAVYCMIPLSFTQPDLPAYLHTIAKNYVQAIKGAGVKRAVLLSGWAADMIKGENLESHFDELSGVSISIMRPASFYSNFYSSMDLIKGKGLMGAFLTLRYSGPGALLAGRRGLLMGNYGGDDRMVFVSPLDIADAVAEELTAINAGKRRIRYVGSEEMSCNEAARIIGEAIGKPYLKWIKVSDRQLMQGLKMAKVPPKTAQMLVDMGIANRSGKPLQNFHAANPTMGKRKLRDFALEFAKAYNQK